MANLTVANATMAQMPNTVSASPDIRALKNAAVDGEVSKVRELIQNKAMLDQRDVDDVNGKTPLMWAAWYGHVEVYKLLLEAKADPSIRTDLGTTLEEIVIMRGNTEMIRLVCGDKNPRALVLAAMHGNIALCEAMLKEGVDPNVTSEKGSSAIWLAASEGHLAICKNLLEARANPSLKNNKGLNAMHVAVTMGHRDVVRLFSNNKDVVESRDIQGLTPLIYAAISEQLQILEILLKEGGADPKAKTNEGLSVVHLVALNNKPQALKWLCHNTQLCEVESVEGFTPLMIAAGKGDTEACKVLFEAGAKIDRQSSTQKTALDVAKQCGKQNVVIQLTVYSWMQSGQFTPEMLPTGFAQTKPEPTDSKSDKSTA